MERLTISNANLAPDFCCFDHQQHRGSKAPSNATPNSLTGTIAPKTGLLQITFGTGVGKATLTGLGVVLEHYTNGGGFFCHQDKCRREHSIGSLS